MAVPVFSPAISVTLVKLVARHDGMAKRYSAAPREIDLTPYLGSAGSLKTAKSLSEPAGGFSITFADRTDPAIGDSLYGLIEPMDAVEIRAARRPELYAGKPLPLIMRGFVSRVRRSETVAEDGSPQRVVVVQGQDAGKLWTANNILFQIAYKTDVPFLDTFQLQSTQGMTPGLIPVKQFMTQLVERVLNAKIRQLAGVNPAPPMPGKPAPGPLPFIVDATVEEGMVFPQQGSAFDLQPLWHIAEMFADKPFNELFVRDEEDGPHLVHRPAPYRDLSGQWVIGGAADPGTVRLDVSQVVSLDLMRSDERSACFYWVPPGNSMVDTSNDVTVASLEKGSMLELDYPNDDPRLYGVRRMTANSNLLPNDLSDIPRMLPLSERKKASFDITQWFEARSDLLRLANRDNSVLEEGTAVVQGNEDLVIGKYIEITRGSLKSTLYCERVAHTISPLKGWLTDLVLIRGDGLYQRQRYAGSPAAAEGRGGPYLQQAR